MDMKKITVAIVGSSGYIAKYLVNMLTKDKNINLIKIGRRITDDIFFDISLVKNFDYEVLDNVDYIIFTAAISSPDICEKDFIHAWNINVKGTGYFIENALARNCRIIFFSSDAVFANDSNEIFTELSKTNPKTLYGKMKKSIEDRFIDNKNFKSLRLSYVISKNDKYMTYIFSCLNNNSIAEIYHPFYRNCIFIDDVIKTIQWLLYHWNEYSYSVLNLAGKELISRLRIIDEVNRFLDKKILYKIIHPNKDFYKNRPQITQIKSIYLDMYKIIENINFSEKMKKELRK